MSWLSKLFGGNDSPMDSANKYLDQIPGVGHQGYDEYINQGKDASGKTKTAYEDMLNDPTGFINKLMEGYKPSEGYNYQKEQLQKELGNTAAAGGIAGTPLDQENQGTQIQKLLSGDMQQFLTNVLGRYDTGLKGEEGIAGRGFDASKQLTDLLGGSLNQQGGLAFQDQQQKNQNKNDLWSMFGKALGTGAGFALGGPFGAALGGSIAGPLSGSSNAPWTNPG
jgi:hypothetical protein